MMDVCSKLQLNNLIPTSVSNPFDVAFCVICIPKFLLEKVTKLSQEFNDNKTLKQKTHEKVKAPQGELTLAGTAFVLSGGGAKPLVARVLAYRSKLFGGGDD